VKVYKPFLDVLVPRDQDCVEENSSDCGGKPWISRVW
jgi:hypothetical protein